MCLLQDGVLSFSDVQQYTLSQPPLAIVKKFFRMTGGILDNIDQPDDTCRLYILDKVYYEVKELSLAHELVVIPICLPDVHFFTRTGDLVYNVPEEDGPWPL